MKGWNLPISNYDTREKGAFTTGVLLKNQYTDDKTLQNLLKRILPPNILDEINNDLIRLGDYVTKEYYDLAIDMEREKPSLIHYNAYGNNINKLITSSSWKNQHDIAAREGVVGHGYNTTNKCSNTKYARIYQMVKLFLWCSSSGLYSCPIAMTDGASKLLFDVYGNKDSKNFISPAHLSLLKEAYEHLTSLEPSKFWTSGQWMTERGGGSDVSINGTRTIAKLQSDGTYRLWGYKWFSSATDANIAITLARIESSDGTIINGTDGVSCFFVRVKNENNELNNINMVQLKDKLGTRQLPTAELELNGTQAILISKPGQGVSTIMRLANITRIHNAVSSCAAIRRAIAMSRGYAENRMVFGKKLSTLPLHQQTLATMEILYTCSLYLTMNAVEELGKSEYSKNDTEKNSSTLLLRLLTPLSKLFTGKIAVAVASEGIECLGGIGYLETSDMPQILRDAQVLPVWEGTTNILSMDVLRILQNSNYGKQIWNIFSQTIKNRLKNCGDALLILSNKVDNSLNIIQQFISSNNNEILILLARDLAYSLARIYAASLLIEHAKWNNNNKYDIDVAKKFINGEAQGFFDGSFCLVSNSINNYIENSKIYNINEEKDKTKIIGLGLSKI